MDKINFQNGITKVNADTFNTFQNNIETAINQHVSGATGDTLPVGSVISYIKAIAPENWLVCDGSAVSRTDYSELFNVIGTTFGTGDGSTTFNLPNLKGKTIVGLDSSDTDFNQIGKNLGEKTHILTIPEMPSHSHLGTPAIYRASSVVQETEINAQTGRQGYSSETGGNQAHNNIQPSFVGCYIIKAKQSAGVVATVVDSLTSTSTTDAASANQARILNEKINGTILYENETGTSSNITLSDNIDNYSEYEIKYKGTNEEPYATGRLSTKNISRIHLNAMFLGAQTAGATGALRISNARVAISENTLTFVSSRYYEKPYNSGATGGIYEDTNNIKITEIIGYK